jgi:hypothetical protein
LRKTAIISSLLSFLIACSSCSSVSKIDRYIKKIDNQKDLTELVTEYIIEESTEHDLTGEGTVSVLTDNDGTIRRIIANDNESHHKPTNYKFYYRDSLLIFSNLMLFNKERTDTISDIDYYFKDKKIIKKENRKHYDRHSEFIIERSKYYIRRYGK